MVNIQNTYFYYGTLSLSGLKFQSSNKMLNVFFHIFLRD
jgi:hypothetical protein